MASLIHLLYVASELDFFQHDYPLSRQLRSIAEAVAEDVEFEVRCFIPRFGVINQRTNNIHEILRLSGINIPMAGGDVSLLVKVASLRNSRLQVYFMDNETFFERKGVFKDPAGQFYPDNDARAIFFCKGVLATIEKLNWVPDIIHCHDWMCSFIPLYLKTIYRRSAIYQRAISIYTYSDLPFAQQFAPEPLLQHAKKGGVQEQDLAILQQHPNFIGFTALASTYADHLTRTFAAPLVPSAWEGVRYAESSLLDYGSEEAPQACKALYHKLLAERAKRPPLTRK